MDAFDASLESAKEISFTIMAMTLSLAAVFLPLVLMSGLMGRIFREFSITIVISILASGIGFPDAHAADDFAPAEHSAARARKRPGWSVASAPSSIEYWMSTAARSGSSCAIAGSRP